MSLVNLLGKRLIAAGGKELATVDACKGASAVGLYFSASWCRPCRGFTPLLAASYHRSLEAKGFRCVLISKDQDIASFEEYHKQMPWLALPYDEDRLNSKLNMLFDVQTIPTLAIVDLEGETITKEARGAVIQDPDGLLFPWPRQPLVLDLIHDDLGRISKQPSVVMLCEHADKSLQHQAFRNMQDLAEANAASLNIGFYIGSGGSYSEQTRRLCGLPERGPPQVVLLDIPDDGGFYVGPAGGDTMSKEKISKFLQDYTDGSLMRQQLSSPS